MATRKKKQAADDASAVAPAEITVTGIKGFDQTFACRGHHFEVGKSYKVTGKIKACHNGFHAVPDDEHPLAVFGYYPPTSRFAVVTQSGAMDKEGDKLASAKITINAEISLGDLTKRAIDWVFRRAKWSEEPVAREDNEGVSSTGWSGAASATGERGAASATGERGAASATGQHGFAASVGPFGRVLGAKGCDLFAREFNSDGGIISRAYGVAGDNGIPADVWLVCKDGKLVPAED